MKNIVELIIDLDGVPLENLGGDALSLVENPAIDLDFLAFSKEMEEYRGKCENSDFCYCQMLKENPGFSLEDACWPGYEAIGTKPGAGGRQVPNCVPIQDSGKFAIVTEGLPPYVEELSPEEQEIIKRFDSVGEVIDYQNAVVIDTRRATFSTVADFIKGLTALDILGRRGVTSEDQEGVEVYRYAGPIAERGFCRAMLRLNKVYRREEIEQLDSANPGFGPRGSETYSVFKYKGSVNCRHYWEKLMMFKQDGRTVFISEGPAEGDAGQTNNQDSPSSAGAVANNARLSFNVQEEQRIVLGPAMIPNKLIKRIGKDGMPYWAYFTPETVKKIAEDFLAKNKHNNTNIEHDSERTHTNNTLLESWIVEDPEKDKASLYGFNVPKGTWMVSYKIKDDETWEMVKAGKVKGFSIEGYFVNKAEALQKSEELFGEIVDILKSVD